MTGEVVGEETDEVRPASSQEDAGLVDCPADAEGAHLLPHGHRLARDEGLVTPAQVTGDRWGRQVHR